VAAYAAGGSDLNRALWEAEKGGTALSGEAIDLCARVDAAIAAAPRATEFLTLNRSITPEILSDLGADPSSPASVASVLDAGPAAFHPAYFSTSDVDPFADSTGYAVHMRLHVPDGTPLLDLRPVAAGGTGLSGFASEREILLPRGGVLAVVPGSTSTSVVGGRTHVYFDAMYLMP
jgi:hypothetical protein